MAVEKGCLVNTKVLLSVVEIDPNTASMTALIDIIVIL